MMTVFMHALRLLSLCIFFFFTSCSLDYASIDTEKSSSPEFVFYDADFTRTEENKKIMHMTASQLEQYSGLDAMYIENASFTMYNSDQEPSITGSCGLLSANMDTDIYHFFQDVHIISYEHDAEVTAENLRWNENTEVLSSELADTVNISTGSGKTLTNATNLDNTAKKDGFVGKKTRIFIEGTGFSAKGIDLSYSFTGPITGSIIEETAGSSGEQNTSEVVHEN